jgi:hypothetical protein
MTEKRGGGIRFSKYHARKTTIDGITFASRLEAARYTELKILERAGEISNLRLQVPYELLPSEPGPDGKKLRPMKYIADFVYTDKYGSEIVEDRKGFRTPEYKMKKRLMWHIHRIAVLET